MKARVLVATFTAALLVCFWAVAQTPSTNPPAGTSPMAGTTPSGPRPEFEDFDKVVADSEKMDGVFKLYRKKERLLLEIHGSQLDKPYLFVSAISKGIGQGQLLGGMTLDEWLITFHRVGDRVQVIHKNVRFRAQPGSPAAEAVKNAYSDSVLASLRILSTRPGGTVLIDFTDFLMADLLDVRSALGGLYRFDLSRSTLGKVKDFPYNVEIEINATYAGELARPLDTVPDARAVSLTLHYSLCALPDTGYKPRLADPRVGYFITVQKDYSRPADDTEFVRYINRWHLEKAEPGAATSPPKKPIIYWIEKTVPFQYRKYVRDGILEWNKAFEKAGFENAIEVRMQPDDADWDPEDVRYTTFRWMTANAGFAMGPSRVNPLNGQIFDADIIFDADFIRSWQREYELHNDPKPSARLGWDDRLSQRAIECGCCDLMEGRSLDFAFGAAAMLIRDQAPGGKIPEEIIGQGLKEVVMHEVGHTLGLRHNFKASTLWKMDELHDTKKTREKGITASVMDYAPINIAPKGVKQGDYFSDTIGPYDYWAIEYGYKPIGAGSAEGELPELRKIASRSTEPELAYSTDEDTRGFDPDPLSNRFDLGKDPLAYAKHQADLIDELWQGKIMDRVVPDGKGYERVRGVFDVLMRQYGQSLSFAARHVGGLDFHRNHKGDPNARLPFAVTPADKQREALNFLKERAFSDKSFQFSPELLNALAPSRWSHWGTRTMDSQIDYPLHANVLRTQTVALDRLYSPVTLSRVLDNERKCKDANCVTMPDVFKETTAAIWSELGQRADAKQVSNRDPHISSFRRGLQREQLKMLINITLKPSPSMPEDARTIAWATLKDLDRKLETKLKESGDRLDDYTRAHLEESQMRVKKALEAAYQQG